MSHIWYQLGDKAAGQVFWDSALVHRKHTYTHTLTWDFDKINAPRR